MIGLSTSLVKGGMTGRTYVKDGLKLYMPYRGSDASEVKFVGTGSTSFDGSNDYVKASANMGDLTSGTVCCWAYRDDKTGSEYLFDVRGVSGGDGNYILWNAGADAITVGVGSATVYVDGVVSSDVAVGAWHHIAISGIDLGDINEDVVIGARYDATEPFDGNIKNFAIWNRALTATEVQNVMYKSYAEVSGRLASGLVSWWALDATTLGAEDFPDPDLDGSPGWYLQDDWIVADGTLSGVDIVAGENAYNSTFTPVDGITYQFTFRISEYTKGGVNFYPQDIVYNAVGTYSVLHVGDGTTGSPNWNNIIGFKANGETTLTIDYVSLKPLDVEDLKGSNNGTIIGATVNTDLYGGDTPVIPRAIDNARTVQADAIGAGSAYFNVDNDDYIEIGDVELLTTAGSISAWVKIDSNTNQCVIGKYESTDPAVSRQYALNITTNKEPVFVVQSAVDSYSSSTNATSGTVLSIGTWYHLCGTFSTSQAAKLYINGVLDTTASSAISSGFDDTSETLKIGNNGDVNRHFDGNIAQVGIWDAILTQATIQSVMEKTFEELTASEKTNLVSYWALDEADGENGVLDKVDETLGSELITNGSFDTDSGWSKGTGVTISGGQALWATSGTVELTQPVSFTSGKIYKVVLDIASRTDGNIRNNTGAYAGTFSSAGTYTEYIAGSGSTFYLVGFSGFDGALNSVSVKEVNGNIGILT